MAGAAAVSTATPAHLLRANKHTAVIAADHLLAGLVLPAGTKESATEPKGDDHDLARPLGLDVFLKNEAVACPVIGPNDRYDTFTFRDASGGRALAQASESSYAPNGPNPCYPTYLTIRGRLKADLLDGGILLTRADAILGLKLSPP